MKIHKLHHWSNPNQISKWRINLISNLKLEIKTKLVTLIHKSPKVTKEVEMPAKWDKFSIKMMKPSTILKSKKLWSMMVQLQIIICPWIITMINQILFHNKRTRCNMAWVSLTEATVNCSQPCIHCENNSKKGLKMMRMQLRSSKLA